MICSRWIVDLVFSLTNFNIARIFYVYLMALGAFNQLLVFTVRENRFYLIEPYFSRNVKICQKTMSKL